MVVGDSSMYKFLRKSSDLAERLFEILRKFGPFHPYTLSDKRRYTLEENLGHHLLGLKGKADKDLVSGGLPGAF